VAEWPRSRAVRPAPGSVLDRLLRSRQRHPGEFDCAVRVVEGEVPGESARWRYRRSAVDPLLGQDPVTLLPVVALNHGPDVRLLIRFTGQQRPGGATLRRYHVIWPGVELTTGARIEVAADVSEADRFPPR
jgi:hypothetical protein